MVSMSSLALNQGLHIGTRIINQDYKKEIDILIFKLGEKIVNIKICQHIVQMFSEAILSSIEEHGSLCV